MATAPKVLTAVRIRIIVEATAVPPGLSKSGKTPSLAVTPPAVTPPAAPPPRCGASLAEVIPSENRSAEVKNSASSPTAITDVMSSGQ